MGKGLTMPIVKLGDITAADVKTYYGIDASDTGRDAQINAVLPGVVAQICNYCRHDFQQIARSETVYVPALETTRIFTKYRPIDLTKTFTLTVDGTVWTRGTDYIVDADTGMIQSVNGDYPVTPDEITIAYTGGVLLANAAEIITVFYELVGITVGLKTRTYIDGEGVEKSSTINALSDNYTDCLERWKQWRI